MCGVIGLIYERSRGDLGRIAAELLRTLEYRGYDSTGAAIQDAEGNVRLVKGVGAPTVMVERLGITSMAGQILCGQVRWATFGAVDERNSQPHEVRCKTHLYGAHNGNVTNCDALKDWLVNEGHKVVSDNDGEMVVHTIEHYFALALAGLAAEATRSAPARKQAMRTAIGFAARKLEGSFAAVIVDPVSRTLWAIKAGSSLYFGLGTDPKSGHFGIASSDLSSVLKLTRVIVPLAEGELVEFDAAAHTLFRLSRRVANAEPQSSAPGTSVPIMPGHGTPEHGTPEPCTLEPITREPIRSRLRAEDIALTPPFATFMEQEIAAQEATVRHVVNLFSGGAEVVQVLQPFINDLAASDRKTIRDALEPLRDQYQPDEIRRRFYALADLPAMRALVQAVPAPTRAQGIDAPPEQLAMRLISSESALLGDLLQMARSPEDLFSVRLLDTLLEREEAREFSQGVDGFIEVAERAGQRGGRLFVTCCGSSLNAAKAGALFFNEIAHTGLVALLPGEMRAQCLRSLKDGDVVLAVSQSGETKDLIDVMNDVAATGRKIDRVAIVNNVNSTLAQEKCNVVIPLRCGPEVAVPATKSFMNQLAVFYGLALRLAARRAADKSLDAREQSELTRTAKEGAERFATLPGLIRATIRDTNDEIEAAAQMLYLTPSIHVLATRLVAVAKEGALKIREVVLNHTEGFEGSEFKHGPNTILGINTLFGMRQIEALLQEVGHALDGVLQRAASRALTPEQLRAIVQAVTDSVTSPAAPALSLTADTQAIVGAAFDRQRLLAALYADYPLIYVTGPDERDIALTVSQINTHKIRGATTIVIAEESPILRNAAQKPPADNPAYRWSTITLPRTKDTLAVTFSATVVLQRLALRMSTLKAQYLDRLGLQNHGVHPDVPKNVSKSITVD